MFGLRSRSLLAKARSSRLVKVVDGGESCSPDRPMLRASSTSARGLPDDSARTLARKTGCSSGAVRSSKRAAADALKRSRSRVARRASSSDVDCPLLNAATSATCSASSRRPMKAMTLRVEPSSQCASSTIRTTGTESADSQMSWKAATATRNESGLRSTPRPSAASRVCRCDSGNCASAPMTGRRSWFRPAKGNSASDSTPTVNNGRAPCASARRRTRWRSTDFPMPASPRTTTAPPPSRRRSTSASRTADSCSRSISSGPASTGGAPLIGRV